MAAGNRKSGHNRLAQQTSPYLLQHADNPVDWYPWGPEAFDQARRRLAESCRKLLSRRAGRIRPGRDDKVLAGWNGLMIGTLALHLCVQACDDRRCLPPAMLALTVPITVDPNAPSGPPRHAAVFEQARAVREAKENPP